MENVFLTNSSEFGLQASKCEDRNKFEKFADNMKTSAMFLPMATCQAGGSLLLPQLLADHLESNVLLEALRLRSAQIPTQQQIFAGVICPKCRHCLHDHDYERIR